MKLSCLKSTILIFLLLVQVCAIGHAETKPGIVNRELTKEEMGIPTWRYQPGISMMRDRQVDLPSPLKKPVIEWSSSELNGWFTDDVFIDREGCTWFCTTKGLLSGLHLIRLDPKGKERCDKAYPFTVVRLIPVMMTNGAILVYKEYRYGSDPRIECLDYNGNTIWQTEANFPCFFKPHRISDNRFMVDTYRDGCYHKVFSLSDGSKISNMIMEPQNITYSGLGPIELPNGGWINYPKRERKESRLFKCYDADFSLVWSLEVDNQIIAFDPILFGKDIFLVGGSDRRDMKAQLLAVDVETGEKLWEFNEECYYSPLGVTPAGNAVVYTSKGDGVNYMALFITKDGNIKSSVALPGEHVGRNFDLVIFNDGNCLFSHVKGLTLFNDTGIIWSLTNKEFGFSEEYSFRDWSVNPSPDGRLVVFCTVRGDPQNAASKTLPEITKIFSFAQPSD